MKKKIKVYGNRGQQVEREINYIPVRYIIALLITAVEVLSIFAILVLLALYIPYFYLAIMATVVGVVISIIASNDNPDYKVPWLLFVICVPIVGFMSYFLFYKRKLSKKFIRKINSINDSLSVDDKNNFVELKKQDKLIATQAIELCNIGKAHLYKNTKIKYFSMGEEMHETMLEELKKANKFIFMEYFIVEEGVFWNSLLEILIEKVKQGVEIKVVYDDIGCMCTLPGNYYKILKKHGIEAVPFSRLKGQADSEFNNRSHRKITVIDGKVGFTGGVNIADEYINVKEVFGKWKDTGVMLKGEAVNELTKLFLSDFYINSKNKIVDFNKYYVDVKEENDSFVIPFGDGPNPIYDKNVGKITIMNMLNQASDYVYITTPYLIIDNELSYLHFYHK